MPELFRTGVNRDLLGAVETRYYLGVDIGGTFTDCVAVTSDGRILDSKTPSTNETSPVEGLMRGLELLAEEVGIDRAGMLAAAKRLGHGTTIGTNLVVERKGAAVGLIATKGHGDSILMMLGGGRTAGVPIDDVFSIHRTKKPDPLVPRRRVREVEERVLADGTVVAPLDEDSARRAVTELLADGDIGAISIALLWSFRRPDHERMLRDLVRELAPDIFVSISSEISPRQGEYERTVATVINSYVGPASSSYLNELDRTVRAAGLGSSPLIMQANGGVVPVDAARRRPVQTIGSGPAGGVAAAIAIAKALGDPNVIATDMGGTSFEVGLIVDGSPVFTGTQSIDQYRYHSTHLDVRSIACGGGSIASADPLLGTLKVGPESAGSDPGPACYGRGDVVTVTDADVVLGLINPHNFLDGRLRLDADASRRVVGALGRQLGMGVEETAAGIVRINSHRAATLIRQRTLERGLDPRDFRLYAFGGAGPVHAFAYARELPATEVVIPLGEGAATLSAFGIAAGEVTQSHERDVSVRAPFDPRELGQEIGRLEDEARREEDRSALSGSGIEIERTALLRYAEQYQQEISLSLPAGRIDADVCRQLEARFDQEYVRAFGDAARAVFQAKEVFGVRVDVRARLEVRPLPSPEILQFQSHLVEVDRTRPIYWPELGDWVPSAVHSGAELAIGAVVQGPAIVELPHTSVAVADRERLRRDGMGNLILSRG